MEYTSVEQALKALRELEELLGAYNHVMGVTYLDAATAAPKGSFEGRGRAMGALSRVTYELVANEKNGQLGKLCVPIFCGNFCEHTEKVFVACRREKETAVFIGNVFVNLICVG